MTHWKRLWCWEGLGTGGEGDERGWDGWMASLTQWTWVWVNSRSWWWTGRPGVLWFMGSQRVGHNWETDLIWPDLVKYEFEVFIYYFLLTNWYAALTPDTQNISVVEHHCHFWFYNFILMIIIYFTHRSMRWQGQVLLFPFYRFNKRFREVKLQGCHEANTILIILSR